MRKQVALGGVLLLLAIAPAAMAVPVTLSDVPAYDWYHGCGPTAAGSVVGYWDLHGYSNLFTADGWADVSLTSNVQDQISSPEHNARYDPTPDDLTKPQSWNSIADWFHTSEDPLGYGGSYVSYVDDAFEGYSAYRGYSFDAWYESYGVFTWADLLGEIDAGRPMMLLVDCTGDGSLDHGVSTLGYDDRGVNGLYYGFYTGWSEGETIVWKQFREMSDDYAWGIGYGTFILPLSAPIPEPATLMLLGTAIAGMVALRRRRT